MSRPDEGLIHQWLDGECTPEESAHIERLVATDPDWAAAVAEARGLIAASSRIVQSLDAVPRAMPAGAKAAPATRADKPTRHFTATPWMRLAAVLVVVIGTAYVLRDTVSEPFVPAARVDTPAPTPPSPSSAAEMSRTPIPSDVPPLGPVGTAERAVPARERGATEGAPAPVLLPQAGAGQPSAPTTASVTPPPAAVPPPAPSVAAPHTATGAGEVASGRPGSTSVAAEVDQARREAETRSRATADAAVQRRQALSTEAPRGAVARPASTAAPSAPAMPVTYLDGCWRITAPPELVAEAARLVIRRQAGDTLVLLTRIGDVTVQRAGDALRGGLQATSTACPSTP